jgi:ParB-like chromosome segregation protein Spo0J
MIIESLPIDSLHEDPANARVHSKRNIAAIKASLNRFGQQKPIVVDAKGVVRAGNGTLAAARDLGWTHIQVVRSDLIAAEATAYAIADNRTTDLSKWDDEALSLQLESLRAEGMNLAELGFDPGEVRKLLNECDDLAEHSMDDEKWMVLVTCNDEADQATFLERMDKEGRTCKALLA